MKKTLLSILTVILIGISVMIPVTGPVPVFAAKAGDSCECPDGTTGVVTVDTAILSGCNCAKNKKGNPAGGGEVIYILTTVVDIMSIGIGILGVIGITIVGIQYLTAGGSEEKTRKAKRRMFEIVIGIVAYVLLYAFLKWLLPAGIK